MKLVLSGPAVTDLELIAEHAMATQFARAEQIIGELRDCMKSLVQQSAQAPERGMGRALCGRFSIHYETTEATLAVSRVLRRRMPPLGVTLNEMI